ncbi:MAG: OmpH family outer membrane protein [Alphaproteobacteria bacterium]
MKNKLLVVLTMGFFATTATIAMEMTASALSDALREGHFLNSQSTVSYVETGVEAEERSLSSEDEDFEEVSAPSLQLAAADLKPAGWEPLSMVYRAWGGESVCTQREIDLQRLLDAVQAQCDARPTLAMLDEALALSAATKAALDAMQAERDAMQVELDAVKNTLAAKQAELETTKVALAVMQKERDARPTWAGTAATPRPAAPRPPAPRPPATAVNSVVRKDGGASLFS